MGKRSARANPIQNTEETLPFKRFNSELESTIKAMHGGSMQIKVVAA